MILICYKKCSTCKGVEKILTDKKVTYEYREIDKENPTAEELKKWHELSGLDIKKFFNTSGLIYRNNNIKDKLPTMSLDEMYELLATDGMLVKRPIIINGDEVLVGQQTKKFAEEI
ncbi:MAG: Spx/MgsR family RNA polymerase-binding regulatory protein [Tissierellia bacterium]|nr:Spx/MgsR family RNA polymerase-binding regulatory protein [Tissierellia bacterium]